MELIDKSALVAEIDNLIDKGKHHDNYECAFRDGNNSALYALKGRIDTLEVKEVDLEKQHWLTPDEARKAVGIAREEVLLEVAAWINDTFIFSNQAKEDFSQTFNIMKELL